MKRIGIGDTNEKHFFKPEEIILLKGIGDNTIVYVTDPAEGEGWKTIHCTHNLKYYQNQLPTTDFYRVNKNTVVQLDAVRTLKRDRTIILRIACCASITVSEHYLPSFKKQMSV